MKYLLPGLFFLAVFGIYPVLYTAYASTTNYGTGHVLSKSQAIDQIQSQSVRPVEGATRYDVTAMKDADGAFAGFALFDPEAEQLFLGTDTELDRARPRRRPADHVGHDGPHVRRVGRRPHRCARRRRADAARLPRSRTRTRCPARPRTRRSRSPAARRSRADHDSHVRRRRRARSPTSRPETRRLPRGGGLVRRRRRQPSLQPGLHRQRRVRQLPRGVHVVGVPGAVLPCARLEPRLRLPVGRRHVRPRPAPRHRVQRRADEGPQDLPLADHHPLRPARAS